MINDTRIRKIIDFDDSNECFPGVDIAGGVCYFLWDRDNKGPCEVTNITAGEKIVTTRFLNHNGIFIRHGQAIPIIEKVESACTQFLDSKVSSQKPFGLRTYVTPTVQGDIKLRYNKGIGPFNRKDVTSGVEWIDKWKVIMSYLTYDHAGRPDKDGKRRIFSTMEILPPGCVCTETYLVIDAVNTEQEAVNLFNYLQTKFVRFLVSQLTVTQHISKSNFSLVPLLDFNEMWSDESLNEKYHLTEEEIEYIDGMIREMNVEASYEE